MIAKRTLVISVAAAILFGIALLGVAQAGNSSAPSLPPYTVEQRPSGSLRVRVMTDLADRARRDLYVSQRHMEAMTLVGLGTGSAEVQITFARPLSIEEFLGLASQSKLSAELITFEARDATGQLHTVAVNGNRGASSLNLDNLPSAPHSQDLRLVGVTVVKGTVPLASKGLGVLLSDPRVYLTDLTPYLLAKEVAARFGVGLDKVQVSVPSPHWELSSAR